MAEKEKEPTEKEKEAEFKNQQNIQMQILLADSGIIGSNYAKLNAGKMGGSAADGYMNTDANVLKRKQQLQAQTKQAYEQEGVAWDAPMPDNGALVLNSKRMTGPALQMLTLGNLEKIVNQLDPTKVGLKVDDKFKGLTYSQIVEMSEKAGENPSEELQYILSTYGAINSSYEKTAAMNVMTQNYLNQEKTVLDSIAEKYKPKEENKDVKKKGEKK